MDHVRSLTFFFLSATVVSLPFFRAGRILWNAAISVTLVAAIAVGNFPWAVVRTVYSQAPAFTACGTTAGTIGPLPYRSVTDSPFQCGSSFRYFHLEDFEDHALNTPGVTDTSTANVQHGVSSQIGASPIDSVDSDDGTINGTCASCDSFDAKPADQGVSFTFDAQLLDGLPTHVALVWTDGLRLPFHAPSNQVTFQAFDAQGTLVQSIVAQNLGDNVNTSAAAEDRLFAAVHPGGIARITMTETGGYGGIEVDHLQYGRMGAATVPECRDGADNDGDGATDFPNDFSCSNPDDDDETLPKAQCQDTVDNDGDGVSDAQDPGCHSDLNPNNPGSYNPQDNDELNPASSSSSSVSSTLPQCRDGLDNDGDGAADYPQDFSCDSLDDNDEMLPKAQCQDGLDNDNDGLTDYPQDPGCTSRQDDDETNAASSSSASTSSAPPTGCIEVFVEAFDPSGVRLSVVPSFTVTLDGSVSAVTDSTGRARFLNVPSGPHTVTEQPLAGWWQFLVTPENGAVSVRASTACEGIIFKNM